MVSTIMFVLKSYNKYGKKDKYCVIPHKQFAIKTIFIFNVFYGFMTDIFNFHPFYFFFLL